MPINLLGISLFVILIASVITGLIGIILKKKKLVWISLAVLAADLLTYGILYIVSR
jgi:hypothetical protein